jgi:carbon starvation protein
LEPLSELYLGDLIFSTRHLPHGQILIEAHYSLFYSLPLLAVLVQASISIVASGTTSKQLNCETDARKIGYGAMLIEGLVAVIALFTVAMLVRNDDLVHEAPLVVFGTGMGNFLSIMGIPFEIGMSFGILAVSTFLLTTLDTSTRLARYILEELLNISNPSFRYLSTLITLILPVAFSIITLYDAQGNPVPAWKAVWPVFGSTNQLLAGLALLVVFVWQKRKGKKTIFILIPMVFMLSMTLWALAQLIYQSGFSSIGIISAVLLILAIILVVEAVRIVFYKPIQIVSE